jgi:hypothetical protein
MATDYTEYCPLCGAHPAEQGEQGGTVEAHTNRVTNDQLKRWATEIHQLIQLLFDRLEE